MLLHFCDYDTRFGMIAASILKSRGFQEVTDVIGGFNAIAKTGVTQVQATCKNA